MRSTAYPILVLLLGSITFAGPEGRSVGQTPPPKPDAARSLTFMGRAEASSVEVRARVNGFLLRVAVKEGDIVKKGQLLAEIDPRPLELEAAVAKAKTMQARAEVTLATASVARTRRVFESKAATAEDLTQAEAALAKAEAGLALAKAELDLAELNLSWTRLTSPIDGRIGRFRFTPGSLLSFDGPALATVVATDPIHVAFDVPETTILKLRRDGLGDVTRLKAEVALGDETTFPHAATIDYIDPLFDPATGAVRVRGVLENQKGLVSPGMSVRIRLTVPAAR
jgi:RND family efflux transporter MFP subunit